MSKKIDTIKILGNILAIKPENIFLKYIVDRIQSDDYRGWHVSQHNRYNLNDINVILNKINQVCSDNYFTIPPGDYKRDVVLGDDFKKYQGIVNCVNSEMGRGTINSIKKTFFPDMERMGLLERTKIRIGPHKKLTLHGKITETGIRFINESKLIQKYKIFTDAIDKLFGNKISELAEMIHLSDYANDAISIYELMFIFSYDCDNVDKIKLLDSYRSLEKVQRKKLIKLVKAYAQPKNFGGNKTTQRDFHNWKNQSQQIFNLLNKTVYFEVVRNKYFRLNIGKTGFYQAPGARSVVPKREYFIFHDLAKRDKFELHHIVPISSAKNKEEAKMVDDYRNLIYIQRSKHKEITKGGGEHVVLSIDEKHTKFSNFDQNSFITAENDSDALYSKEYKKVKKVSDYNSDLLKSIFEFEI